MRTVKKWICIISAILLASNLPVISYAYDGASPDSSDIVYIIDVSGSMDRTDRNAYTKDAMNLGIDLAPDNSKIAIIALSAGVDSEMELTDVSTKEGRVALKEYVKQLRNNGNTDFSAGLDRAVEILESSNAINKRIIMMGDFSEGGYNAGSANAETEIGGRLDDVAARAMDEGINIDLVLWEQTAQASSISEKILALPQSTGGNLLELTNPNQLPSSIEDIYFDNYKYTHTIVGVRGESGHTMNMQMPTNQVKRARIYVSAKSPAGAFGASYSGANLDGEQNRSYSMIDLINPTREGVSLTLTPGESGDASVYLLLDYDSKLTASVTNETELIKGDKEYTQTSTLFTDIVDAKTGNPLLTALYGDNVTYKVTVKAPSGSVVSESDSTDSTTFIFKPSEFGAYTVNAELTVGDLIITPKATTVNIEDVRPIVEPLNWPLIIALSVAAILILSALLIAYRRHKKESELHGAVEMASDYKFHGKLYVCAVMVDGGNEEIAPFEIMLYKLKREKRISLKDVLASGKALHHFPGAENILFLVGPEESIIIRNNADVTMRVMGKEYGKGTKAQLFYGQKSYLIFSQDENELEIYYRSAKNEI